MRPKNGGGEQPYHLLEEAKQLAKDNLLKQAHEKLEQVITLTENDADLEDVHDAAIAERGRLPVRAADVIEQVRGQIDELLALMPDLDEVTHAEITTHGEDFTDEWYTLVEEYMRDWRQEIEGYLSRWEDAILGDSDRDYNRMQQRVEARARELQRELFIGGVRAEVHQRWETVDDMIERGERIAPSTVVNYYGQARDAVRKALDYYPDKPELDVLRDRAEQLRDQKALGAQVYTSAVQGEYYAKALQDLEGLPPDEEVPRYVFVEDTQSGQLVERFDAYITREEAQRDLEERAADWAREKATEYLNNAERYLNEHHPNRALDELKGRSKLERFLESDYKKDFDETEENVKAELEKYKEANAVAEKVTEHLNNPLVAWSVYEDARNIYEWADGVATARETVIAKISSDLQRILDEARQAYEARNISTVGQLSQEAKEKYQDKDIAIIQGLLDEIDVVQRQADTFRDQLAAAEEMLDGIDTVLDDDPGLATSKLRELKNTFDSDVLDQLERLHDIETRVSERGSAEDKLENLKGFLTSESISRVKGAIGQARTDKNRYSHDERFENIQRDLELHLEYLEAERSFQTNQYMDALPHFEHVSAQRDHPDADDASNRVREIRQMIEREESINTELNSLENMLSEDPATAYFAAIELDIADQQQLKRRNALAEKAKRHASNPCRGGSE